MGNEEKIDFLTLSCSANERTEMKLKIYLSEAWMCSEFGYQRPMSNKKGLKKHNRVWFSYSTVHNSTVFNRRITV